MPPGETESSVSRDNARLVSDLYIDDKMTRSVPKRGALFVGRPSVDSVRLLSKPRSLSGDSQYVNQSLAEEVWR